MICMVREPATEKTPGLPFKNFGDLKDLVFTCISEQYHSLIKRGISKLPEQLGVHPCRIRCI